MPKFVSLLLNENMKIYRRAGTWVMAGLLVAVILLMGIIINYEKGHNTDNWQNELTQQNMDYESMLAAGTNIQEKARIQEQLAINEYRLAQDIPPLSMQSLWGFVDQAAGLTLLITVFTVVIAAGIIASEFSTGTIKLLLIRPVSRAKILLSKYISTLVFPIVMLIILFIFSLLIGGILFGFGNAGQPQLVYSDGSVIETNMVQHILTVYGYSSVELVMIVTLAFMISSVFRSSSLAIGLSLILLFVGGNIVMLLSRQYEWVKYVLFANTNLTQHTFGAPIVEGMTMTFSITVLAVYFIIFNLFSWLIFTRRDVAS